MNDFVMNIPGSLAELESLISQQRHVYDQMNPTGAKSHVIMGTGYLAALIAERLKGLNLEVVCYCDNNPAKHSTVFFDRPVLSVIDAVNKFGGTSAFVVAIYNPAKAVKQLSSLGAQAVVTAPTFCRHLGDALIPIGSIDYPTEIFNERNDVRQCMGLWEDAKSRTEFANVINWFLADTQEFLEHHDPAQETYFPNDLWKDADREHFVDCGAFDGDSVQFLLGKRASRDTIVTAFEPDPSNYMALLNRINSFTPSDCKKVRPVNAAVGASAGILQFSNMGNAGSTVSEVGAVSVPCVKLDEYCSQDPPTFIKMDVEGYELEALAGAAELLASSPPILAITTYHRISHTWQIPLFIHRCNPDYKLYFRRYAEDCWETICYAVPPSRTV